MPNRPKTEFWINNSKAERKGKIIKSSKQLVWNPPWIILRNQEICVLNKTQNTEFLGITSAKGMLISCLVCLCFKLIDLTDYNLLCPDELKSFN